MKKTINKKFTLVELLVAMAVFSILLLVSMQIFGASQRLWVNSEQKNNAFASARAAMEFIAARIQTHAYSDNMPFYISKLRASGAGVQYKVSSTIYFPTAMPMNRKDASGNERDRYNLRFVCFSVTDKSPSTAANPNNPDDDFHEAGDGVLRMHIFSDGSDGTSAANTRNFLKYLPPYRRSFTYDKAIKGVRDRFENNRNSDYSGSEHNVVEIAENVTAFRLLGYRMDTTGSTAELESLENEEINTPPYLLTIQLSVIDSKANFKRWQEAASDTEREEIFQEHGYTFQRAVLIRQRR